MKIIQLPVILDEMKMLKDGSVMLKLETRELQPNQIAEISSLANKECWIGLAETNVERLDVPESITEFDDQKSPSQRLRNVLYVYHRDILKGEGDFEKFRIGYMEKIIKNIKDKLPNEKEG